MFKKFHALTWRNHFHCSSCSKCPFGVSFRSSSSVVPNVIDTCRWWRNIAVLGQVCHSANQLSNRLLLPYIVHFFVYFCPGIRHPIGGDNPRPSPPSSRKSAFILQFSWGFRNCCHPGTDGLHRFRVQGAICFTKFPFLIHSRRILRVFLVAMPAN